MQYLQINTPKKAGTKGLTPQVLTRLAHHCLPVNYIMNPDNVIIPVLSLFVNFTEAKKIKSFPHEHLIFLNYADEGNGATLDE